MTIWYWGDGTDFDHYYPKPKVKRAYKQKPEEDLHEVEANLRAGLEWIALSHAESLMKLMEAPEGTPTVRQRGKRTTSEPRSDYDSWKPNYHNED